LYAHIYFFDSKAVLSDVTAHVPIDIGVN